MPDLGKGLFLQMIRDVYHLE